MTCLRCKTAPALPMPISVLALCTICADALFPGPDVAAYKRLVARYGYPR